MNEFRITKYNPSLRNELGHYTITDEWTEFSDVGKSVNLSDYEKVESTYIAAAILFASNWSSPITVTSLEDHDQVSSLSDGQNILAEELPDLIRDLLRYKYWCRVTSESGFIHIGYDSYMYVGSDTIGDDDIQEITNSGLFVEKMPSPYKIELS